MMAKELDEQVADFRHRPLDAGLYTFVAADALVLKVREGGRVMGVQLTSAQDGAGWLTFFWDLTARGLSGVALVTSDAHRGSSRRSGPRCPVRRGCVVELITPPT
jgi:putative transposase